LLIIAEESTAQDTLQQTLVDQYFTALNNANRSDFNELCYQYNSNIEFYKEAYRYFYYRSQFRVLYEVDELSEIEIVGGYENDTIEVQYGKYSVKQIVDIGDADRNTAYQDLNNDYDNSKLNSRVDPLNIIRKTTFFRFEYDPGFINGTGQQYFLFITTKTSGKTQLIPFDLTHSWALTQVLDFDFILEAFRLTSRYCDASNQNMNKLGEDMFAAIKTNDWYTVYCKYGITAEVLDTTKKYEFSEMNLFSSGQNDFLHELHVRQDIVRVNTNKVHRKMKGRSPHLFMVHTIEQEENGKQFCNVLLELKIGKEYEYVLVVCQKKSSGWRINNGPLTRFSSPPVLDYIKKLKRK
jgi:hypothetical protein